MISASFFHPFEACQEDLSDVYLAWTGQTAGISCSRNIEVILALAASGAARPDCCQAVLQLCSLAQSGTAGWIHQLSPDIQPSE